MPLLNEVPRKIKEENSAAGLSFLTLFPKRRRENYKIKM
jgi:hypothetical protein